MSTLRANTLKPITSGNSLVLQGDSGGSGVSGPSIDSNGDVDFSQNADAKIKLPSGGGIYESDGLTEVLIESSGVAKLGSLVVGSVPVGSIFQMAFNPDATWLSTNEYLICDGSTLNSTTDTQYADLYSAIGTTWGGSSASAFQIPDLRGEFLRGLDGGRGVDSSRTFASFQEGSHHVINTGDQIFTIHSGGQRGDVPVTSSVTVRYYNGSVLSASFGTSDTRYGMARPRNIAVQFIIKY